MGGRLSGRPGPRAGRWPGGHGDGSRLHWRFSAIRIVEAGPACGYVACSTQWAKVDVFMRKAAFRLRARDWVGSAAGFAAALGTLVALDPRVGHRLSQFVAGSPGGEFRGA